MARLGQTRLAHPFLTFLGAKFWHVGVLVGLIGILEGDATGFAGLDMPRYAAVPMFVGCLLIAICGALTLYERRERHILPFAMVCFCGSALVSVDLFHRQSAAAVLSRARRGAGLGALVVSQQPERGLAGLDGIGRDLLFHSQTHRPIRCTAGIWRCSPSGD